MFIELKEKIDACTVHLIFISQIKLFTTNFYLEEFHSFFYIYYDYNEKYCKYNIYNYTF